MDCMTSPNFSANSPGRRVPHSNCAQTPVSVVESELGVGKSPLLESDHFWKVKTAAFVQGLYYATKRSLSGDFHL